MLALGRDRLALWAFELAVAVGTILISLSLVFNGERDGGAAGGDEVYYLWIALYSAHYFSRRVAGACRPPSSRRRYAERCTSSTPGRSRQPLADDGRPRVGTAVIVLHAVRAQQAARRATSTGRRAPIGSPAGESPGVRGAASTTRSRDAIARASRLSLLLGDVDRLKEINDRWGHAAGDAGPHAGRHHAARRATPGRHRARVGGDEFAVLCRGWTPRSPRRSRPGFAGSWRDGFARADVHVAADLRAGDLPAPTGASPRTSCASPTSRSTRPSRPARRGAPLDRSPPGGA